MAAPRPADPGKRQMTIKTRGLERLDFYVDGRPQGSIDLEPDAAGSDA